jgi:serine/threonine protein kinase
LGITVAPNPQCIVTEFLDGGSLTSLLYSRKTITQKMLYDIVYGIAAGVLHLHKEGIVHRDLAARNVLMTSGGQVKISDFGMSRKTQNSGGVTKTENGPLKWMAPECLYERKYSIKTDVWAFGVTLFEIVSRGEPYPGT